MKTAFETQACSRCGGGGHYGRNAFGSTTCYSCGGSGRQLTKRGRAARQRFLEATTVEPKDVQPGWLVWWADLTLGGLSRWASIASTRRYVSAWREQEGKRTELMATEFITIGGTKASIGDGRRIRAVESIAARDRALQAALAYQGTLDHKGREPITSYYTDRAQGAHAAKAP